jgi:hypothetical protein
VYANPTLLFIPLFIAYLYVPIPKAFPHLEEYNLLLKKRKNLSVQLFENSTPPELRFLAG